MPKLTIKPKLKQPNVQTFLTNEGTLVGDAFSSYLCSDLKRVATLPVIKQVWPTLSKGEQEQARLFVAANGDKVCKQRMYPYWFITTYRNLDSGRSYKTVGCSVTGPGVTLTQIKSCLS